MTRSLTRGTLDRAGSAGAQQEIFDIYIALRALAIAVLAVGACASVAILNGFPLVFSDTGTYLVASHQLSVPWDRPIFYGLFLRPFLFGMLWPAVAAQSAVVVYLMWAVTRIVSPSLGALRFAAMVIALCVLSPLAWVSGKLLPDIFAAVAMLGIFVIMFGERELSGTERVLVWCVTALAIATHLSHLPLFAIMVAACGLARAWLWGSAELPRRVGLAAAALLLAVAAIFASNLVHSGKPTLSRGSGLFAFAKLLESGAAQAYLRQACPEAGYAFCAVVDELPRDANAFLWDDDSPIRQVAGTGPILDEARTIALNALAADPLTVLKHSARGVVEQLGSFSVGNGPNWDKKYLELEGVAFDPRLRVAALASRQANDTLPVAAADLLTGLGLLAAFAAIAYLAVSGMSRLMGALLITVAAGVVGNAIVCGGLSVVDGRYEARVIWLVAFVGLLAAFQIWARAAGRQRESNAHS